MSFSKFLTPVVAGSLTAFYVDINGQPWWHTFVLGGAIILTVNAFASDRPHH